MNAKVDAYVTGLRLWQAEVQKLREVLLITDLKEDFKWGRPCYTFNGKNIIGITTLKDNCALNIFNGAALNDPKGLLTIPGEHTQTGRWMKFSNLAAIKKYTNFIIGFINEAIDLESSGKIKIKVAAPKLDYPLELQSLLNKDAKLDKAFGELTPGRQRAYIIYFSAAKKTETRVARIKKYIPKMLCGKGFNDCTCGLSKRMPSCDGSHKFANK